MKIPCFRDFTVDRFREKFKGDRLMGCDIHPYIEERINGKWVYADTYHKKIWDEDNISRIEYSKYRSREGGGYDRVTRFPSERNYLLFAFLAGVRNPWDDNRREGVYRPISEPRGLPKDVSDFVKEQSDRIGPDGHSHSWLTIREIINFNWNGLCYQFEKQTSSTRSSSFLGGQKSVVTKTAGDLVGYKTLFKILSISDDWDNTRVVFWFDN